MAPTERPDAGASKGDEEAKDDGTGHLVPSTDAVTVEPPGHAEIGERAEQGGCDREEAGNRSQQSSAEYVVVHGATGLAHPQPADEHHDCGERDQGSPQDRVGNHQRPSLEVEVSTWELPAGSPLSRSSSSTTGR